MTRSKSLSQKEKTKIRIHANVTDLRRKKMFSESLSFINSKPKRKIHQTDLVDRRKSLPVCTINFMNYKSQPQGNVTIYNNYLCRKLGYTKD